MLDLLRTIIAATITAISLIMMLKRYASNDISILQGNRNKRFNAFSVIWKMIVMPKCKICGQEYPPDKMVGDICINCASAMMQKDGIDLGLGN